MCAPENVSAMPIYFLLHKCRLNHGLIPCLSKRMEWVDSSQCDSDQCEFSRDLFDSNLESTRCDSNLKHFRAQLLNFEIIFVFSISENLVVSKVFHLVFTFPFDCDMPQKTLLTKSKMPQFLRLVLVTYDCGLLMVLDGFIPMLSSAFYSKSTLISVTLFQIPEGKSW